MKKTDHPPFRGVLAMSGDELSAFIRDNKIELPTPTPESRAEAQWEEELFKAIESGEIGRKKPGRKVGKSKTNNSDDALAQACLDQAGGRASVAMQTFIKLVCAARPIQPERARNLWYEVTVSDGRTRRVR